MRIAVLWLLAIACGLTGIVSAARADEPPPEDSSANPVAVLEQLGKMLDRQWKDRPEAGDMAAAILKGDFMRPGVGWWTPSQSRYDWKWLAAKFDANQDGVVTSKELKDGQLDGLLERLDRDEDGKLAIADFQPPADRDDGDERTARRLFARFDTDSNGKLTKDELLAFFEQSEEKGTGYLTLADLQAGLQRPVTPPAELPPAKLPPDAKPGYRPGMDRFADLEMFLQGAFGSHSAGPKLNAPAPDFTLPYRSRDGGVTLSELRGKPVVLVFGSFT